MKRGLLSHSPAEYVERLHEQPLERDILSLTEAQTLLAGRGNFDEDIRHYSINLLAATTGMRMGEIQALSIKQIVPDGINISQSWGRQHGMNEPKWGSRRWVGLTDNSRELLEELVQLSPYPEAEDLVFFGESRHKPIDHKTIEVGLYDALARIGIDEADRRHRNLTFHSWRHWFKDESNY